MLNPHANCMQEALTPAAAGKAMSFPQEESKALKAYGLPTNILVDVGHFFYLN